MASTASGNANDSTIVDGYSPSKATFARYAVRDVVLKEIQKIPLTKLPEEFASHELPLDNGIPRRSEKGPQVKASELKIGIIGAGIAGLYSAMLLDSQNIKYEILEANPHRIGGRLYTHKFETPNAGEHQYYDIGAMRFPKTPIMERTFKLFKRTHTELGKYIMSSENQPMRYNDITKVLPNGKNKWHGDPFHVSTTNEGPVPPESVSDPDVILQDAYAPYRRKIKRAMNAVLLHRSRMPAKNGPKYRAWEEEKLKLNENLDRAYKYLMKHDQFSLRDYLSFVEAQDDETIHWLETLNSATGWFDQAFSENVLESLAFEYTSKDDPDDNPDPSKPGEDVEWKYIKNGSSTLTENVLKQLKHEPEKGKRVTGMALVNHPTESGPHKIEVTVAGESSPRVYDSVITTTTFSALQKMDLARLKLPYATKAAIRSLRYDTSTKVAIQFKEPWWINSNHITNGLDKIKGGLGKTDLPLRTCVYPSYNLDDGAKKPAVLLCSYTWGADSERIASMINPVSTSDDDTSDTRPQAEREYLLKELMIDNLARLHSTDSKIKNAKESGDSGYKKMYDLIQSLYITHHAYDWSKDPYTCGGAFALYSPSQFKSLYPHVVQPVADSRVHIVGEAASAHHAWVVGALDSAARGTHMLFERFGLRKEQENVKALFGPVEELDEKTAHLQVALGMLDRENMTRTKV